MTWRIYRGTGEPGSRIAELPPPPPWRSFNGRVVPDVDPPLSEASPAQERLAVTYRPTSESIDMVNAALVLRRPLLVTGPPGTGKSSLAYSVAHELRLGRVLRWPITSRSTLADGLYRFDAVGHWQSTTARAYDSDPHIGSYFQLGPLGSALAPSSRPRVLLIDDLDQGDLDLPYDLAEVFEQGEFSIPELSRRAEIRGYVVDADGREVVVERGRVQCGQFPLVVLTSNGEREFAPGFLRRCLRLHLAPPDQDRLLTMVEANIGETDDPQVRHLVAEFLARSQHGILSPSQLLNAIYLTKIVGDVDEGVISSILSRTDEGSVDGW